MVLLNIAEWVTGLSDWVKLLGGMIVTLSAVAGIIWAIFKKPIRKFIRNVKAIYNNEQVINNLNTKIGDIETSQSEMKTMLTAISNEFKPNGGLSMNDKINSIQQNIKVLVIEQRLIADDDNRLVFWIDMNGQCYHANDTFLHATGLDMGAVKGKGWTNTIANEDFTRVRADIDLAAKEQRSYKGEFKMYLHGFNVPVECVAKPIPPDNNLIGFKIVITPRN